MKVRAALILALVLAVLLLPSLAAEAQPAPRMWRIGWLSSESVSSAAGRDPLEFFLQGLGELGYVSGRNFTVESRSAEGNPARLPELADELVGLKVDVIVTGATVASLAAKRATTRIPIVVAGVGDPVTAGLVASLARPGGNVTGLSLLQPELAGKRLHLLQEVIPGLSRVALLWNRTNSGILTWVRETEVAAPTLGVKLQSLPIRAAEDTESVFSAAARERAGAMIVIDDPFTFTHRARIIELASYHRLPTMHGLRQFADAGGLIAYGPSLADNFRRAAIFVEKILKGAKPADLPIEQPTKFELVINLKTAKALGLTIPQSLLLRADQVIE